MFYTLNLHDIVYQIYFYLKNVKKKKIRCPVVHGHIVMDLVGEDVESGSFHTHKNLDFWFLFKSPEGRALSYP